MENTFNKYEEAIRLSYEHAVRMLIHLRNIRDNYQQIENPDEITKEVYRDSIIKKYELLEDLMWKLLSKVFKSMGLDLNNPRGCYKQAFKEGWIKDIAIWDEILLSRNSTAHVYDEEDYEMIKNRILESYIGAIEELMDKMAEHVRGL